MKALVKKRADEGLWLEDVPIPEIPLDEFMSVPATEGKKVRVADPSVRLEENGWMLLQAGIEVY